MTFEKPNSASESSQLFSRSDHPLRSRTAAPQPHRPPRSYPHVRPSPRAQRKTTAAALTALRCKGLCPILSRLDDKLWDKCFWTGFAPALQQGGNSSRSCSVWPRHYPLPEYPLRAAASQLSVKAWRGNAKTKTDVFEAKELRFCIIWPACLIFFSACILPSPSLAMPCLLFFILSCPSFTYYLTSIGLQFRELNVDLVVSYVICLHLPIAFSSPCSPLSSSQKRKKMLQWSQYWQSNQPFNCGNSWLAQARGVRDCQILFRDTLP